jgi:hypothetical protein
VSVSYISLIAMMPSEYSVAGSQPSTITGAVVSYVNTALAGCDCELALGGLADPEHAASVSRGTVAATASQP